MKKHFTILIVFAALAGLFPIASSSFIAVGISALLFTGWASSWNLLGGWAGQLSLGHASFVGLGAYFVALGTLHFPMVPWWAILLIIVVFASFVAFLWGT